MSKHPSNEDLFLAAGQGSDAETVSHLKECASCRARFQRLSAGASVIDSVRNENAPQVNWRALDVKIMAEAERTSAAIRAGVIRPARRVSPVVYGGIVFAAAAAGVMMIRGSHVTETTARTDQPIATISQLPPSHVGPVAPVVANLEPDRALEAVVLMVVSPVEYHVGDAPSVALTGSTIIREGGRVAADEHGGRTVLALESGYRFDIRSGTNVQFDRLSSRETTMVLSKGEARIDGPARSGEHVAMEASGWSLAAKGGAFVAKIEGNVVRVQVLSGKIGVSRSNVAERDIFAGDEIILPSDGSALRLVSHDARDPQELNMAFLTSDGRLFDVPALPVAQRSSERVSVSVAGFGTLPAGVSSIRANAPIALRAQVGVQNWSMVLGATATTPDASWRRVARASGTVAVRAPIAAVPSASEPTQVAPSPVEPTTVANAIDPQATTTQPARPLTHSALEDQLATRASHCFDACRAANNCGSGDYAYVAIDPDPDGRVVDVRITGFSSAALNACVQSEARGLRIPGYLVGTQQLHLQPPTR